MSRRSNCCPIYNTHPILEPSSRALVGAWKNSLIVLDIDMVLDDTVMQHLLSFHSLKVVTVTGLRLQEDWCERAEGLTWKRLYFGHTSRCLIQWNQLALLPLQDIDIIDCICSYNSCMIPSYDPLLQVDFSGCSLESAKAIAGMLGPAELFAGQSMIYFVADLDDNDDDVAEVFKSTEKLLPACITHLGFNASVDVVRRFPKFNEAVMERFTSTLEKVTIIIFSSLPSEVSNDVHDVLQLVRTAPNLSCLTMRLEHLSNNAPHTMLYAY